MSTRSLQCAFMFLTKLFYNSAEAAAQAKIWKQRGEQVTMTNGCFDILHLGHAVFLEQARYFGRVIVGVNSDAAVRTLKGEGRPINSELKRAQLLCALESVDGVVIVNSTDMVEFMEVLRPTYWVKGKDYSMQSLNPKELAMAKKVGAEVRLLSIIEGISTTNVIREIKLKTPV